MWFAYVMRSRKDDGIYVGMSSSVERRVKEHNAGYNRSTRSRIPFELIYVERCGSRLEARKREKYLKSGTGREYLGIGRLKSGVEKQGGGNSTVESRSSKAMVAGSNPVPRSNDSV